MQMFGRLFQERTDVFQRFASSGSGVLLCTVSVNGAHSPTPLGALTAASVGPVFQDVAARGLDLPQVTWILQVSPDVPQSDPLAAA